MKVGYLGLGVMGSVLSVRLLKNHDLSVWDLNPGAVNDMAQRGAKPAGSAAELARNCDAVVICLPRTSDVQNAVFGPAGLAQGLKAGKVVIDQTSGVPGETHAMARQLAERGVLMIDAPVSGGVPAAQAGTISIIASGPDGAWEVARPVLEAMSSKVFRCSDRVGDGQALKLVTNAVGAGYRMTTLELVALGRKRGLSLRSISEALNAGAGANFTTRNMLAGLVEGRATTNFALSLMVKDLNEAIKLGAQTGTPMPMSAVARGMMQIGLHLFGKDARLEDVIPLIGKFSGVTLAEQPGAVALDADKLGGLTPGALLAVIDRAVEVCNQLVIYECLATGAKFGLRIEAMATILLGGSAWSKVAERMLPALTAATDVDLKGTLGGARADLRVVTALAATCDVPLLEANAALSLVEAACNELGEGAPIGKLIGLFERASGVTYASRQTAPG